MSETTPEQDKEQDKEPTPAAPERRSWVRRYLAVPTLVVIGLLVYLSFFGENSISRRVAYQQVIDSLTQCLHREQDSLEYYRDLNRRLSTDPELMEQVVREQYNMNRPNEDVYVIEKK